MGYGDTEATKIAECRLYTATLGFLIVNTAALLTALTAMDDSLPAHLPTILAGIMVVVGNPCVVLAAWGDSIKDVIDHILSLFKRKEKK